MVVLSRPPAFSPNDALSDIRRIAEHLKVISRPVEACCNEIQLAADRVRGQIAGLAAVTLGLLGMNTSEHGRMIRVNRAPVLTLWATVIAERLGFDRDAALTLGRAVAGSSAQMKGRALGIYEPSEEPPSKAAEKRQERLKPDEAFGVRLLGRTVPAIRTPGGLRAPLAMI